MYYHGLFIQPNITLLICLQRLCDHTFCHPMMHLPVFFDSCVCPSKVCLCIVIIAATSVRVYTMCLLRNKVVWRVILMQFKHLAHCPCSSCPTPSHVLLAHIIVLHEASQGIRLAEFFCLVNESHAQNQTNN